jgi:hypothetical protein
MVPNDLPAIPYKVKVFVTYHRGVGHGPLKSYCYLYASMNSEGRQVLHVTDKRHNDAPLRLDPGCYAGGMVPIVPSYYIPTGTMIYPIKGEGEWETPKPLAKILYDTDTEDFFVYVEDLNLRVYGGFSRHSAEAYCKAQGYRFRPLS